MAHPRKLIRQAVVALLAGASTAAGSRVLGTRVDPHKKTLLPAIGVYTLNDSVDDDTSTQTEEAHELELEIAGWVLHTDAVSADDAMDDLAEQIENAMKADPYLGGKASMVRFAGTVMELAEENGRGAPLVGIVVLTYIVTYRSDTAVVPVVLDDFLSVTQSTQIVGGIPDDNVPANDEFIVQEIVP